MQKGNIYTDIPDGKSQEIIQLIKQNEGFKFERIVSHGQSTPEGEWYDQEMHEWVVLLSGAARLKFAGERHLITLSPGDWVLIPAHERHRVEWTDPEQTTVWLALFYR